MKRISDRETLNITGANIKKARLAAKMSQQTLSNKLETRAVYICRGSVARLEVGARIVSDIELKEIADILGITISKLFENVE